MKKLFLFISLFMAAICLSLAGCSKPTQPTMGKDSEHIVAEKICQMGASNLTDEMIKALSVVVRTNLLFEGQNNFESQNSTSDATSEAENATRERVFTLVGATKGEILTHENLPAEVHYSAEKKDWSVKLKKWEILSALSRCGVMLSNISHAKLNRTDSGKVESVSIGGKTLTPQELSESLNLPSDIITSAKISGNSLVVTGERKNHENCLYYLDDFSGKTYTEILNSAFDNLTIINNNIV